MDNKIDERAIEKQNLGKIAEAIWPHFVPLILKKKREAIEGLKNLYRAQKTDPSLYIAQVAIVTAFDDLISDVERQIKISRDLEKEVFHGH